MNVKKAVVTLASLAQETRLRIFRLLVETGKDGMNASAIAEFLDIPPATLSFHVAHLVRAGLVAARHESRFIFYSVNYSEMDDLIAYLSQNCCKGTPCLPKTVAVTSIEKKRRVAKKSVSN